MKAGIDPVYKILFFIFWFENLVAKWRSSRNSDYIKTVICGLVATVAGISQQQITTLKTRHIHIPDCLAYTIQRLVNHFNRLGFGPVCAIFFDIVEAFFNFMDFKICEFPVLIDSSKPELFMMHLDAAHKLAKPRFIAVV